MATLRKRGETWYLQEKLEGRWVSRSLHTSDPAIAKASLAKAIDREGHALRRHKPYIEAVDRPLELAELAKTYENSVRQSFALGQISEPTIRNVSHRLPIVLQLLRQLGVTVAQDVCRATVRKFTYLALEHPYAPTTVSHLCALCSQMWEFALEDDNFAEHNENPWSGKKLRPRYRPAPKPALTPEEYVIARQECHDRRPEVRFLVFVGAKTGRRISSILRLRETDFCAETKTLQMTGKGKTELVEIDDQLCQFLLDWPVREDGHYIRQITQPQASARVGEFFKRLRRLHPGKFRKASHHSFRRTAGTALRVARVEGRVAADALGHSSLRIHEQHYVDERARKTGSTLSDALRAYETVSDICHMDEQTSAKDRQTSAKLQQSEG